MSPSFLAKLWFQMCCIPGPLSDFSSNSSSWYTLFGSVAVILKGPS